MRRHFPPDVVECQWSELSSSKPRRLNPHALEPRIFANKNSNSKVIGPHTQVGRTPPKGPKGHNAPTGR